MVLFYSGIGLIRTYWKTTRIRYMIWLDKYTITMLCYFWWEINQKPMPSSLFSLSTSVCQLCVYANICYQPLSYSKPRFPITCLFHFEEKGLIFKNVGLIQYASSTTNLASHSWQLSYRQKLLSQGKSTVALSANATSKFHWKYTNSSWLRKENTEEIICFNYNNMCQCYILLGAGQNISQVNLHLKTTNFTSQRD